MSQFYKYTSEADFITDSVAVIEDFIAFELEKKEVVKIALSGGESPRGVYEALGKSAEIDWNRIDLFQVDERYKPDKGNASNLSMIEQSLLGRTPNLRAMHSIDTDLPLNEATQAYDQMLQEQDEPLFDLVILGLGEDGHTASLFPGIPELAETKKDRKSVV